MKEKQQELARLRKQVALLANRRATLMHEREKIALAMREQERGWRASRSDLRVSPCFRSRPPLVNDKLRRHSVGLDSSSCLQRTVILHEDAVVLEEELIDDHESLDTSVSPKLHKLGSAHLAT